MCKSRGQPLGHSAPPGDPFVTYVPNNAHRSLGLCCCNAAFPIFLGLCISLAWFCGFGTTVYFFCQLFTAAVVNIFRIAQFRGLPSSAQQLLSAPCVQRTYNMVQQMIQTCYSVLAAGGLLAVVWIRVLEWHPRTQELMHTRERDMNTRTTWDAHVYR